MNPWSVRAKTVLQVVLMRLQRPRLSPCTIDRFWGIREMCKDFSTHTTKLLDAVLSVTIDEVSLHWLGRIAGLNGAPSLVLSKLKPIHRAYESKCLNDSDSRVRIGLIPVGSASHNEIFRQTPDDDPEWRKHNFPLMPSTMHHVVRLLFDCHVLGNGNTHYCIVDAGFASVQTIGHLYQRYSIKGIGPVKGISTGSLTTLTKLLDLDQYEGFVAKKTFSDPLLNVPNTGSKAKVVPGSTQIKRANGRFGGVSPQKKPQVAEPEQIQPVVLYSYSDGYQVLVTPIAELVLHHHFSEKGRRHFTKLINADNKEKRTNKDHKPSVTHGGFQIFSPRYLYRTRYNTCDIFNRAQRQFRVTRAKTQRFEVRYTQFIVENSLQNAMQIYNHFGGHNVTSAEFRHLLLQEAYDYKLLTPKKNPYGSSNEIVKKSTQLELSAFYNELFSTRLARHTRVRKIGCHYNRTKHALHCSKCSMKYDPDTAFLACTDCCVTKKNQIFCGGCAMVHMLTVHKDDMPKECIVQSVLA